MTLLDARAGDEAGLGYLKSELPDFDLDLDLSTSGTLLDVSIPRFPFLYLSTRSLVQSSDVVWTLMIATQRANGTQSKKVYESKFQTLDTSDLAPRPGRFAIHFFQSGIWSGPGSGTVHSRVPPLVLNLTFNDNNDNNDNVSHVTTYPKEAYHEYISLFFFSCLVWVCTWRRPAS